MIEIKKTAIVSHSIANMFRLVDDITSYPDFLPWCHRASEQSRTAEHVVATLEVGRGITKSFTTRNTLNFPQSITMALVEGPFSQLTGQWLFEALGSDGCRVTLELFYEPKGFDKIFSTVFHGMASSLVEAFCQRADKVYVHAQH